MDADDLRRLRDAGIVSTFTAVEREGMDTASFTEAIKKEMLVTMARSLTKEPPPKTIGQRLRALKNAPNEFADHTDEELETGLRGWVKRWGWSSEDPLRVLKEMEKGELHSGGIIDFIPARGGVPEPPPKQRMMVLGVEYFGVGISLSLRRIREREDGRAHVNNHAIVCAWLQRALDRAGHTRTSLITTFGRYVPPNTLLDEGHKVVYANCDIIPFGQTYGLPSEMLTSKQEVVVPVPDHMKEEPDAP